MIFSGFTFMKKASEFGTDEAPSFRWRVVASPDGWGEIVGDWQQLSASGTPMCDPAWAGSFVDAFGAESGTPVLHALYEGDRIAAVLPLSRVNGAARAWVSLENEHSPYWSFPVSTPTPALARKLLAHLLADADYLFFRRFHLDRPMCRLLVEAARQAGLAVSLLPSEAGDSQVALLRPFSLFRASLSPKLNEDLGRKLRKLEKLGALRLELLSAGPALDAALAACFDLEAQSWKGDQGSPISARADTLRFYSRLARDLGDRVALCLLRLDERIIAFEYWMRGGGQIEALKISFDSEFARLSPGYVLRYLALKKEIEEGDAIAYHIGRPSPWKARWATSVEPLCSLRIYAPTVRGRAAWLAGPVLRAALKQSAFARSALAAIRERAADSAKSALRGALNETTLGWATRAVQGAIDRLRAR